MSKVKTSENITALIYNKDDAKSFLHSGKIVSAILPLTPVAHSILIDNVNNPFGKYNGNEIKYILQGIKEYN